MTVYNVQFAKHVAASVGTVDTFNFAGYAKGIRVINRTAASTNPIYFTLGRTAATTTDPVVGGDDTYIALPFTQSNGQPWLDIAWPGVSGGQACCVKTIVATGDNISVMVFNEPTG